MYLKEYKLISGVFCFFVGTVLAVMSDISVFLLFLLFFAALSVFYCFYKNRKLLIYCVLLVLLFLFGFMRVEVGEYLKIQNHINEGNQKISGIVSSETIKGDSFSRFKVSLKNEYNGTNILFFAETPSFCRFGENVNADGNISLVTDFITDSGRVVPYKNYLKSQKIDYLFYAKEYECNQNTEITVKNKVKKFLFGVKERFLSSTERFVPEPEESLLAGILLGQKFGTEKELLESFRIAGLLHIVVLSGYNITLVAEATRRILFFLPKTLRLILSIIFVILFVFVSGAEPPAVRAGIMGSLVIVSNILGRQTLALNLLFVTSMFMVLANPLIILYNTSFQLSMLATAGLIILSPKLENKFKFITNKFQIRGIVAATLSTQIFLLPYLVYKIGEVSLVGILANILVLPLIPLGMLFGFITGVFGLVFEPLAQIAAVPTYFILKTINSTSVFLSSVPFASVELPALPIYLYFIFTSGVLFLIYILYKK